MPSSWPLVERDGQLARVADAMERGRAGVLLAGPAGVGKTRLATELLDVGAARGWRTEIVRANQSAATIPFGAFVPLLPAVPARGAEGQADSLRAASKAVVDAAGDSTLLLVVDDAHQLDDASAALLQLLAVAPAVFLVVTVRVDEHALAPSITALWKDELLERIEVPTLSDDGAQELVTRVLGGPVDGGTAHMLWTTSGGNALFLRELVVGALDAGVLQETSGMWRLRGALSPSTRLGEVVQLRLGALDEDQRLALELVSVGEPVGVADLELLVPANAIDDLQRRGLLDIFMDGGRHQARIAHPLYGEVVRAGLPLLRRREICRTLADVVEHSGARRREDTMRAALWRLDGGGAERPEMLLEGAHQARFAFDLPLCERLARAAYTLAPSAEAGCLLGEMLDMVGRHDEAEDVLAEAETLATSERDRALTALARSSNLFRGLGRSADAEAVVAAAEAAVRDEALRDELRAQQAVHLLFEGRFREVFAITDPLLARAGDRAFAHAALPGAVARALSGRTAEAIDIADRAFEARVALGDQVQMSGPGIYLVARALALLEAGRLAEAAEYARLGYDGAAERQLRDGQAWFSVILGRICLNEGRVAAAARWFREAAIIYGDYNHAGARWGYGGLAHALALSGDLDGADAALADLDAEPPTPLRMMDPDIERGRACVLAQRGQYSLALDVLRHAAADAAATGRFVLESAALHDLARLGEAAAVLDRLRALADVVDGAFLPARLAHADALARHDGSGLDAAADAFEEIGALLLAAEASAAAAHAHTRDGLVRRAGESRARAARLADACEGARTPALADGAEITALTRREREVAELAARGLSNREVAEKLFVSTRTVENHLQRAYEKLGVRSRAELADALGIAGEDST
jgi:ATP/maltotriose-dependent transcriptional regulator MalT